MHIRPATSADLDSLVDLHVEGWRQSYADLPSSMSSGDELLHQKRAFWERHFTSINPHQILAVVEREDGIAGMVCASSAIKPRGEARIEHLHVRRALQRAGIGRSLVRHSARWCVRHFGSRSLSLSVVEANRTAVAFYSDLGAKVADRSIWCLSEGVVIPLLELRWDDLSELVGATDP